MKKLTGMKFHSKPKVIITLYLILFFAFSPILFIGVLDIDVLKGTFEKLSNISFTIVIGYSALLAAVVSLSKKNNKDENKDEIHDFIQFTIFYVVVNLFIYIFSTMISPNDSYIIVGVLILLVLTMLFLISLRLSRLVLSLFY
ncbi:hypothetical protein M5X00_13885 [Paenibacillus alvei]|uniref:hypothetical protein n=1 Tax=Paenibacillus alvei TaxID=44250 RepID=UPI002281D5B4|nr:hypothetical protein [Paenibacillus alvei]MCY9755333.1 hypothetical protein [Paenibacillus alvei]